MDASFWLGLAASIPIGFAVNLLTPALQQFFESREAQLSHALPARVVNELEQLREFSQDAQKYEDYRFIQLMRTTIIGTFGGVLAAACVATPQLLDTFAAAGLNLNDNVRAIIATGSYLVGVLITIITGIMIINIARESLRIMSWVRKYPEYERRVRARLGDSLPLESPTDKAAR